MAYVQRENTGNLFPNDRKEKETQPDFKGTALINGVTYEIGAWRKTAASGKEFTSLSFKVQSATYRTDVTYPPKQSAQAIPPPDLDGLPF